MRLPRPRFTVQRMMVLVLGVPALAAVWVAVPPQRPAEALAAGGVSLLQTLAEWKYPGANMLGASMSDGGNPLVQSIKCQSVLTTPDPIEKVIAFYAEKVGTTSAPGRQDAKVEVKEADAKAVSTQDDSQGRPVKLRIIVVNQADTSTTLVISRDDTEKETHIAWSHYLRLDGKRALPAP